jgi:L,D-peptidoglycan transpeptidase YkuD (ErfK/YbiS/YcfS/YnhG family)
VSGRARQGGACVPGTCRAAWRALVLAAVLPAAAAIGQPSVKTTARAGQAIGPAGQSQAAGLQGQVQRTPASPEARLHEIYRLIGAARTHEALVKAQSLVRDVPNFQLAQLVYGDLLIARSAPLTGFGGAVSAATPEAGLQLEDLRREAQMRLQALQEQPPADALPRQFVALPRATRHAVAVDASRARLYLFQQGRAGLELAASHYVSLGRAGIHKSVEGDQRTPLGVYFITSRLFENQLKDFYGPGALPINYPNEYDRRQGRTGSRIWLHGVPRESYSRGPQTTDGCVVLANDDLERLLQQIEPIGTPVVIAERLEWVTPQAAAQERRAALDLLEGWRQAKSSADLPRLASYYSARFASGAGDLVQWLRDLEREVASFGVRNTQLKDVSVLAWRDHSEILVVTFGEVRDGLRSGPVKRQYWGKEGGEWKIFFEGVIG